MSKIIVVTGGSKGFGKIWAEAFLKRGYKVAVTARRLDSLQPLVEAYGESVLPVQLNVDSRKDCFSAVEVIREHFGRIDVLINNAGYGLFGTIEETTEREARDQMETNFFGVLWMSQAVLPIMRNQKHGHIIQVSSYLGLVTLPVLGIYNASKFAVEGFSETLASEVSGFGIKVSLIEPNGFATDWSNSSAVRTTPMNEYNQVRKAFSDSAIPEIFGDPNATAEAVINLVNAENPPLRLFLGKIAYPAVTSVYQQRLREWSDWKEVADAAHGF